jgi:hypothetical protein
VVGGLVVDRGGGPISQRLTVRTEFAVPLVALAESSWSPAEVSTVKCTPLPCCTPLAVFWPEFWKFAVSVHGPSPGS